MTKLEQSKVILKCIFFAFLMPWRLIPINYQCECGKPVFFKQPRCGYCLHKVGWEGATRYNLNIMGEK